MIKALMDGSVEGFGGLSWSACEIRSGTFSSGKAIAIRYSIEADGPAVLQAHVYLVEY